MGNFLRHTASSVLFPELRECACSIHGITVLNLLDAHLQGCMELVICHGVGVQSRRSFRQGQREGDAASHGDLAQVHINSRCHRDTPAASAHLRPAV